MARQVHLFWCMIITLVGLLGARRVVCTADEELFQWKRLTQENFTSIHSNAFTLCIVMLSCKYFVNSEFLLYYQRFHHDGLGLYVLIKSRNENFEYPNVH